MTRRRRSRLNFKVLAVLLAVLLATGGGVYAVHRHQVAKSATAAKDAGFKALAEGDLPAATTHLGHYCSFAPEDLDAREAYAQLLLDGWDQKKKAYELREHILQKDPSRDTVRLRQIHLALGIDRAIDARSHLDILLKKTPDDAELIYLRGRCAEADSKFEDAAGEYRRAIEADPLHTPAHEHLAWLLERELDQPEDANAVIDHLEAGSQRDVDTLRVLAEFHAHRRHFKPAAASAKAAIEQRPDDVRLLAKLAPIAEQHADVLARRGEVEAAGNVFAEWRGFVENGIQLRPKSPTFYIILAHLQQSAGDHDAAIATLRRGLTAIPDGDELAFLIVQQLILTDRIDLAEAELEDFPETAGGRTYRETLAGLIAVRRKKFETAKSKLQSVVDDGLDDNPFAENVRLQLARCCEALDDWADAASIYEDILRRNPANETARLGLAVALLAMGRHEEGVAEMKSLSHLEGVLQHFVLLEAETTARKPEEIRDWGPLQKFLEKKSSNVEPGESAWLRALIAVAQRDLVTAKLELRSQGLDKTDSLFDLALVVYSNRKVPLKLLEQIAEAEPQDVAASSAVLAAWAQDDFQRVNRFVKDRLGKLSRKERLLQQAEVASICQRAGELTERADPESAKRLFDQAEALLRQLVELDPHARTALVEFLVARSRSEEATTICESAFGEGSVEFAVLWLDAAQTHPDAAAALARLEAALQTAIEPSLTPTASSVSSRGELQLVLADLFTLTERYAEAETTYRRVLREAPGHPVVQNNLAWLLAMQNRRLPEALELIEATIAEQGSVPQLLDTRGCVRLALGEDEEARLDFEMSVMLEPSPDALFHLAVAEMRLDDAEAARKAMRRAKELGFRIEFALPLEKDLVSEVHAISAPSPPGEEGGRGPDEGAAE
jgi:tetratricopeptide (TPR) repeat protein